MKFKNLIKRNFDTYTFNQNDSDPTSICLYPVGEYNLEGVKLLYDNCKKATSTNNNVRIATVDVSMWLGEFLDKYWDKISFVSSKFEFSVFKIQETEIVNKKYNIKSIDIHSEDELDNFFKDGRYKTLVLFSVVKNVDLQNLKYFYKIRYSEISDKNEIRDKKINDIVS